MTSRQKTSIVTALEKAGKLRAAAAVARHMALPRRELREAVALLRASVSSSAQRQHEHPSVTRNTLQAGRSHRRVTCWGGDAVSIHLGVSRSASPRAGSSSWVGGRGTQRKFSSPGLFKTNDLVQIPIMCVQNPTTTRPMAAGSWPASLRELRANAVGATSRKDRRGGASPLDKGSARAATSRGVPGRGFGGFRPGHRVGGWEKRRKL